MKSRFLFPNRYRIPGFIIALLSLTLGIAMSVFQFEFKFLEVPTLYHSDSIMSSSTNNLTDEIASLGLLIGLILIAFSKQKTEDERVAQVRLESLQWSVYINYIIFALLIIVVNNLEFLWMVLYNMFTLLIFLIVRFHYVLHKQNNVKEEEL